MLEPNQVDLLVATKFSPQRKMQNLLNKLNQKFAITILLKRWFIESLKKMNGLSSCFSNLVSNKIDLCITNFINSVIICSV